MGKAKPIMRDGCVSRRQASTAEQWRRLEVSVLGREGHFDEEWQDQSWILPAVGGVSAEAVFGLDFSTLDPV